MAEYIIIVTGANSGVGFGICHRLLLQLSQSKPTDILAESAVQSLGPSYPLPCQKLVLIMACRNIERAEKARRKLLKLLDADIARQAKLKSYNDHAETFRRNLEISIHSIDLTVTASVLEFTEVIITRYAYVSHLICNAGFAAFNGTYFRKALKQMSQHPLEAVTTPKYLRQQMGMLSNEGYGMIWQCNVFGHYLLYYSLYQHRLFQRYTLKYNSPARIIWMSTLGASGSSYVADDFQLLQSSHPYETSKYQLDLIVAHLNQEHRPEALSGDIEKGCPSTRHFSVEPGIVATGFGNYASPLKSKLRALIYFTARLMNSNNHPSSTYKAAVSSTHAALIPLYLPELTLLNTEHPMKICSHAHLVGREHVSYMKYQEWTSVEKQRAIDLLQYLDQICETLSGNLKKPELVDP